MKKIAILGAVAAVVFSSCGTGAGSLKTEQDSLAYAVGLDFGNYVKGVDSTLDVNVIAAGIKAVLANDTTTMTREAAYNFMRDYFMVRKPKKEKEAKKNQHVTEIKEVRVWRSWYRAWFGRIRPAG